MAHVRFDFGKVKGASIKSIALRETSGKDEQVAAAAAEAKGRGSSITAELVRLAIEEVDDQRVEHPVVAYEDWNTKTRNLVFAAWKSINGSEEDEEKGFLATAQVSGL